MCKKLTLSTEMRSIITHDLFQMSTRVTRASLRAARATDPDNDPPDGNKGSLLAQAAAIITLHLLPGTLMISAGAVDITTITSTPTITGAINMPTAIIAWAMVSFLLTPIIQMAARNPTKIALGIAAAFTITTALGLTITAAVTQAQNNNLEATVTDNFRQAIKQYGTNKQTDKEIDSIQEAFGCCGALSYHDYSEAKNSLHGAVPESCCHGDVVCPQPPIRMGRTPGCARDFTQAIAHTLTKEMIIMTTSAIIYGAKGLLLLIGWATKPTLPRGA